MGYLLFFLQFSFDNNNAVRLFIEREIKSTKKKATIDSVQQHVTYTGGWAERTRLNKK